MAPRSYRRRRRRFSTLFWLMTAALAASFLPSRFTAWARALVVPLTFVEYPVKLAAQGVASGVRRLLPGVPTPREADLIADNEELRRQIGQQSLYIQQLDEQIAVLSGLRDQLKDPRAVIRVAAVLAIGTSPRDAYLTISRGTSGDPPVKVGDWVVAARNPADLAEADLSGREVLARFWVIGRVTKVGTFTSVVQLSTDPGFGPVRIQAARVLADQTWQRAPREALLYGRGDGAMEIDQAEEDYLSDGFTVAMLQIPGNVPLYLSLGEIVASRSLPNAPLHYDLKVRPPGNARLLKFVYVLSGAD